MFYHSVRVGVDASGRLLAWHHRLVGQSFIIGTPLETGLAKNGVDVNAVEGIVDIPYAVPNLQVDWHNATSPVTTVWWRSVGHTHTAHAVEVMIDNSLMWRTKIPLHCLETRRCAGQAGHMKSDSSIYKGNSSTLRGKSNGGKIGLRTTPIWGMSD